MVNTADCCNFEFSSELLYGLPVVFLIIKRDIRIYFNKTQRTIYKSVFPEIYHTQQEKPEECDCNVPENIYLTAGTNK